MKKTKRLILIGTVLALSAMSLALARTDDNSDGLQLQAAVTDAGTGSGISGTAVVEIGEDGLHGRLKAENLKVGHGYTVWFFYLEGGAQAGPGRFDSTVAEDDDFTFRGRVRGLRVSSGAQIKLRIFDHPDLGNPNLGGLGVTNANRANNLLTPMGGSKAAEAVFTIP